MIDQDQNPQRGPLANDETHENHGAAPLNRKQFIEPEISQPVDVLEATTFFQAVDSGATN